MSGAASSCCSVGAAFVVRLRVSILASCVHIGRNGDGSVYLHFRPAARRSFEYLPALPTDARGVSRKDTSTARAFPQTFPVLLALHFSHLFVIFDSDFFATRNFGETKNSLSLSFSLLLTIFFCPFSRSSSVCFVGSCPSSSFRIFFTTLVLHVSSSNCPLALVS